MFRTTFLILLLNILTEIQSFEVSNFREDHNHNHGHDHGTGTQGVEWFTEIGPDGVAREVQMTRAEVERRILDLEARGITGTVYRDAYGIVRVNRRGDGVRRPGDIIPDTGSGIYRPGEILPGTGSGIYRPGEILPDTSDPWVERSFEEQRRQLEVERLRKEQREQEKRIKELERRLAKERARKTKSRNPRRRKIPDFMRPPPDHPVFSKRRRGRQRGGRQRGGRQPKKNTPKPRPPQRKQPTQPATKPPPRNRRPSRPKKRCRGLIGCLIHSNRRLMNKVKDRLG